MKLDRTLQLQILERLRDFYPHPDMKIMKTDLAKHDDFYGNIYYLREHGLIEPKFGSSRPNEVLLARITHLGLDFLEQDGGIGAILKTSSVKIINVQDFLALIEDQVVNSDLPEAEKKGLLDRLKTFSTPVLQNVLAEALKKLPALLM